MKKAAVLLTAMTIALGACSRVKEKTKSTINKGGETIGKSATEFIEGVSEGVDKTLECTISLSKELQNVGLQTGTFTLHSDAATGNKNKLTLYLIFKNDTDRILRIIALNKSGLEVGRSTLTVKGKAGEAGYFDFTFDERTNIEHRSTLQVL